MVALSVIIPTRDGARRVRRTLAALDAQDHPAEDFEVIVVPNACTDDTAAVVRGTRTRFALRLHERAASGISAARNGGAAIARGRVLVFLDDDIEPLPSALAARAAAHAAQPNLIAIGPLLAPLAPAADLLSERLRALDADAAAALHARAGTLDWSCMTGGNMSIDAALFARLGGFDADLAAYGGEDYELGCRAQQAGARFVLLAAAAGRHVPSPSTLATYVQRARSVGRNEVAIVRRHPQILAAVPLGRLGGAAGALGRLGQRLALDHPRLGDCLAYALLAACAVLARGGLRRPWNGLVDRLHRYWYFRGVADRVGDHAAAAAFVAAARQAAARPR